MRVIKELAVDKRWGGDASGQVTNSADRLKESQKYSTKIRRR